MFLVRLEVGSTHMISTIESNGSSNGGRASDAQLSANGAFFFSAFALRMRSNGSGGMERERKRESSGWRRSRARRSKESPTR